MLYRGSKSICMGQAQELSVGRILKGCFPVPGSSCQPRPQADNAGLMSPTCPASSLARRHSHSCASASRIREASLGLVQAQPPAAKGPNARGTHRKERYRGDDAAAPALALSGGPAATALGPRGSPFLSHARPRSGTGSRESREGRAPRCLTGAWSRCSAQRLNSEGSRSDSTEALAQAGAAEVLATGAPTPQGLAIRFLFRQGPGLTRH